MDIYFVEARPDVLVDLPPGVIVSDSWSKLDDLERVHCRCMVPHLSDAERLLLEDVLDAHDRLWDGDSSAAEIWALYAAAAETLRPTPHFAAFGPVVAELAGLVHSGLPAPEIWDRARGCTYDLRRYAARQLRWADRDRGRLDSANGT